MFARVLIAACLSLAVLTTSATAQQPAVADLLKAASDYLTQYAQKIVAIAADEEYTQREPAGNITRKLHSDVVWVGFDGGDIASFRDVHGLDGHQLRPRDDRMLRLFANPSEAAQVEARSLQDEGARHYISQNLRALDQPMFALDFLRAANQAHSEFELDGVRTQDGVQVATLKWKTKDAAAVLPVPGNLTATGKVWLDVATGVIRQTEIGVSGKNLMARMNTKFANDPKLGLWLPSEHFQTFEISSAASGLSNMGAGGQMGAKIALEGRARFSKYRRAGS